MEIIPAIDLIDGKCVRLTQGDYDRKKIYNENPLEVARQFEEAGLRRLHLVDLDGAKAGKLVNLRVLETLASGTSMRIDYGGGIKRDEDIDAVFSAGAAIATVGSIAVKEPDTFYRWLGQYGGEKILAGADVRGEHMAVAGWTEETGLSVFDFLSDAVRHGLTQAFCTDIARDGLLQGPSVTLYQRIIGRFPALHFIASGGVSSGEDLLQLKEAGCAGAIVGKAIYEGRIRIADLALYQ